MPLTLLDVRRDPIASRALDQLGERYIVAEEKNGLVLSQKAGDMKLFLYDLDDLHQWDFVQNKNLAKENEQLRALAQKPVSTEAELETTRVDRRGDVVGSGNEC